jgi:hypothetical protein
MPFADLLSEVGAVELVTVKAEGFLVALPPFAVAYRPLANETCCASCNLQLSHP